MATTNKVKGWTGVLMTEDSSSHWPTKRRHVYYETSRRGEPVLSSFVFLDTTGETLPAGRESAGRGSLSQIRMTTTSNL